MQGAAGAVSFVLAFIAVQLLLTRFARFALDQELAKPGGDPKVPQYLALALGALQTAEAAPVSGRLHDPLATLAQALERTQPLDVRVMAAVSLGRKVGSGLWSPPVGQ